MHRLHMPAVTRPVPALALSSQIDADIPQTTLVLPPDVRLIDKLAESAVHDCLMLNGERIRSITETYIQHCKGQAKHRPGRLVSQ